MTCSGLKDFDVTAYRGFSNWEKHHCLRAHLSLNVEWTFTSEGIFFSCYRKFIVTKDSCQQNETASHRDRIILITQRIKQFLFYHSFILHPVQWPVRKIFSWSPSLQYIVLLSSLLSYCGCHICSLKPVLMYQLFWSGSAGVWTNKLDCAPIPQIAFPLSTPAQPTEAVHYIFSWNISIQAISLTHIHMHTHTDSETFKTISQGQNKWPGCSGV